MFLRCSYFLANLSLNVLINMVLTQKKECSGRVCGLLLNLSYQRGPYSVGNGCISFHTYIYKEELRSSAFKSTSRVSILLQGL